ncbi:MAG TPA: chemotaxis protein CheA [Vicinamibacterales bacterium]|nr:chemotaxis protein CheA [Vicinamibacterales bacterium]
MSDLTAFVKQFLEECSENLDALDRTLVELEKDPGDRDKLASIFRTVHTIKGTSGFFGFSILGGLAHDGEDLLSRVRDGKRAFTPDIASALLELVDATRRILANIDKSGTEGDERYTALGARLISLCEPSPAPAGSTSLIEEPAILVNAPPPPTPAQPTLPQPAPRQAAALEPTATEPADHSKAAMKHAFELLERRRLERESASTADEPAGKAAGASPSEPDHAKNNVRVDVARLDKLMDLVGELVLARNQILALADSQRDTKGANAFQRLNLVTTELQEGIMKARLQPIETIWGRFPRVVRDLASLFDKKVRLELQGSDTELDRTIIEAIRDPLTHLVRNCVDHGIEAPVYRAAKGKDPEGRLLLRAFHEGGQVVIEISDDGAGIDVEVLKRKAVDLGLITAEQAHELDERAAMNLIFLAGFSTAERVTDISGRGVGMDVVKTNIEKIGGAVEIESALGEGTTLRITIPLTLTIIPALTVAANRQRYAIPRDSVVELVRLETGKPGLGIEMVHGSPVYRLRGSLLPVVYLKDVLGGSHTDLADDTVVNLVVTRAAHHKFGLVVDEVSDSGEIVVKPLGRELKQLKGLSAFAGATIMGDGRVALILDVVGLARRAQILSRAGARKLADTEPVPQQPAEQRERLLLFTAHGHRRMAIPLSHVTRLEEFPRSSVEWTGNSEVVQYQGQILPLIDLNALSARVAWGADHSGESTQIPSPGSLPQARSADGKIPVIVSSRQGLPAAGVKVERILDIVEEPLSIGRQAERKGSLGTAIIQGRVTEVLDLAEILEAQSLASSPS